MTRQDADWASREDPHVGFEFPDDGGLLARIRDYFLTKYAGDISATDAAFLARIFADVTALDLVTANERRVAALRMVEILVSCDRAMSSSKDPVRTWAQIGQALGLPSATETTQTAIAKRSGISRMAISKVVKRLRESFHVGRAFTNGGSLNFH